jgi:hypothetical protein
MNAHSGEISRRRKRQSNQRLRKRLKLRLKTTKKMHNNTTTAYWDDPSDDIEKEEYRTDDFFTDESLIAAYREASYHFLKLLYPAIAHVTATATAEIGLAQIRFALGIAEISMSDQAAKLNVTPQCISKGAREFIKQNNLPVPPCMESEESSESHRRGRINSIKSKQL